MTTIYGVDTEKEVTPSMVRDAMMTCFFEAHCADTGLGTSDEAELSMNKTYCSREVKKLFGSCGANFENPTKDDIMKSLKSLAEFSKNFRDQEIIKKHYDQMMALVGKLQ